MMVLAFIIGLVPSHDTDRSGAAVSSNGRVDMVDILDLILGSEAKQSGVTLESRIEGVVVKTPEDNAEIPVVPVPVMATVEGDGNDLVTFVANVEGDAAAFPGSVPGGSGQLWSGDVSSAALSFPWMEIGRAHV